MNLHEYQAKQLFNQYGLAIPTGTIYSTEQDFTALCVKLGAPPWIAKCQIHAGGRGKSGGIKLIYDQQGLQQFTQQWLGKKLVTYQTDEQGQPVSAILLEQQVDIARELYFSIIIDRRSQRIMVMVSSQGGTDIELIAQQTPQLVHCATIDPLIGAQAYQARELAQKLALEPTQLTQFSQLFVNAVKLFNQNDLTLLEINPLVVTKEGNLLCLDAKVTLDNNAAYRHPNWKIWRDISQEDPLEVEASQNQLNYVTLTGNIGCLVNGAGLAMATMDMVKLYGGKPANFLDVGGSTTKEQVSKAFNIILNDKKVTAVFVNIFGGIVRCDLIAEGIIAAFSEVGVNVPVIVRLEGNQAELGAKKIKESGLSIISEQSLIKATKRVIAAAGGHHGNFN